MNEMDEALICKHFPGVEIQSFQDESGSWYAKAFEGNSQRAEGHSVNYPRFSLSRLLFGEASRESAIRYCKNVLLREARARERRKATIQTDSLCESGDDNG